MPRSRQWGFTLIELMVVVAIVALLAAIAFPIYNTQVRKGRRAEAREIIAKLALGEEKWRVNNATFSTKPSDVGGVSTTAGGTDTSTNGYYTVVISNSTTG